MEFWLPEKDFPFGAEEIPTKELFVDDPFLAERVLDNLPCDRFEDNPVIVRPPDNEEIVRVADML